MNDLINVKTMGKPSGGNDSRWWFVIEMTLNDKK